MENKEKLEAYWKENLKYITILLAVWFGVSYGAGILFVDAFDSIRVGGFGLGFFMANVGSELSFLGLILAYVVLMNNLDRKYDLRED